MFGFLFSAIDFSGISLPFTVTDLVSSGSALLSLVGSFVLLGMAFLLAPRIIQLIRRSFGSAGRS